MRLRLADHWRHVRQQGVLAMLRAFIDRFVYHSYRCLVTYSNVDGPPVPDRVGGITFHVATQADLDRLGEFERYNRGATHRKHVEGDHDWLFLACDGDRIVATRRSSLVIRNPVVSRVVTLKPHQFWGADLFCLPEYRNRHIGRQLKIFGDRHLASLGYKDFVSSVEVSNTPSLRAARAAGRRVLYYVAYRRVFGWERLSLSTAIPRRFWADLPAAVSGVRTAPVHEHASAGDDSSR